MTGIITKAKCVHHASVAQKIIGRTLLVPLLMFHVAAAH